MWRVAEVQTIRRDVASWEYQQQNTVTQSSTKSKYITLSESGKEKKFTLMLLQEIANVESPGYIYGNNEASISIPNNKQLSNITKNIDITEQFIR